MASAIESTDGQVALEEAWAPIAFGEGPRVGLIGDSRCGKTKAAGWLIKGYLQRSTGTVLVVDDKEPQPQYEGQCVRDRAALEKVTLAPEQRVIVFRGERFDRIAGEVDPEEIAEIQWAMAQRHLPSLVVYDELDKAAKNGQWVRGDASTIRWAFKRGGSSGCASLWGTQETQDVPAAAFNQSSSLFVFRCTGAPLRLLGDRGYLEPRGSVEAVIPKLPGDELPPGQRGYFVHLRRGRPWDGKVYRFR